MLKDSCVGVGIYKPTPFNKRIKYIIIVLFFVLGFGKSLGKDINPQEDFNMSKDWKIISYGFKDMNKIMVADAKLAFKDSINGVLLQLFYEPSNFGKTFLEIKKTSDGGYTWDSLICFTLGSSATVYDIAYNNQKIILLESEVRDYPKQEAGKTKLWISNDDGNTWKFQELQYYEDGLGIDYHKTKIVLVNDSTFFILFRFDLIRTTDNGDSWVNITQNISWANTDIKHRISDIEIFKDNLYLSTFDKHSELKFSQNLGESWKSIKNDSTLSWFTNDLIVKDNANFFVLAGDYNNFLKSWNDTIFASSNSGYSWDTLDVNLSPDLYKSVNCKNYGIIIYTNPYYIYLLQDEYKPSKKIGGDKFSDDYVMEFNDGEYLGDKAIFVDKYYGNIWLYTFPSSSVPELSDLSDLSSLSVSPNPARDYITINFDRWTPSETAEIAIYNTLGVKVMSVKTLHATSLQINISALPKGMYFVKAGGETAKLMKM